MIYSEIEEKIKNGYLINEQEAIEMYNNRDTESLLSLANNLRLFFDGTRFDSCSIINARSGKCSEDCKWCSQSKFYKTNIEIYPLVSCKTVLQMAINNASKGVGRFSLVTSGRTVTKVELEHITPIYEELSKNVNISLCASMGLLNKEELQKLYDAGCKRYHCNLETAPSYFTFLCSTHTIEEKIETLKAAKEVGMSVCSGGIIGMGETAEQRIELAFTLRKIGVDSIPVNVLNPIPGTPLENTPMLPAEELLKSFAIFKIINPRSSIRFAGGRILFTDIQRKALQSGVSAAIVGDMLTTSGADILTDMKMLEELGFTK